MLVENPITYLAFSGGKDALATWVALCEVGFRVLSYYRVLVPEIECVERGLRMYEEHFSRPIYRPIHPSRPWMLRRLVFQPPERTARSRI